MVRRGVIERFRAKAGARMLALYASVDPNPTIDSILEAVQKIGKTDAASIVAIGGGSVLDSAKGIAAQFVAPQGWLAAHLRNGASFPEPFRPLPLIAVPTTAGTGSEATMWATIWDGPSGLKHSLSHPALYPTMAFIDPELTLSAPRELTVTTALDALSHSMESIWNRKANPISNVFAAHAITTISTALPRCLENPANIEPRTELHTASSLAGLAISSTQTALAHSMSYPLTGELGVPHGLACSATLPELLRLNGNADPRRVEPILGALACHSVSEASDRTADLLSSVGAGDLLRRYVTRDALLRLRNSFINPRRTANNVCQIDDDGARSIWLQVLDRFGIQ